MAFGDTRGEEPELLCAPEGEATSGFVDHDQDDCPITIESWNEYANWSSQLQPVKIIGLFATVAGVGLGIGVGITAVVQKARKGSV